MDPYFKNPILYILMRTDLESMNAGKAVAQGTHAANQLESRIAAINPANPETPENMRQYASMFQEWKAQADGFGTAICLEVNERQLRGAIDYAQRISLVAGVVHDPTYPLKDGSVLHLLPLDTCGYIFGEKHNIQWLLTDLELMK